MTEKAILHLLQYNRLLFSIRSQSIESKIFKTE